jgi:hypothetical protein
MRQDAEYRFWLARNKIASRHPATQIGGYLRTGLGTFSVTERDPTLGPASPRSPVRQMCALSVFTGAGLAGEQPFQFAASLVAPGV